MIGSRCWSYNGRSLWRIPSKEMHLGCLRKWSGTWSLWRKVTPDVVTDKLVWERWGPYVNHHVWAKHEYPMLPKPIWCMHAWDTQSNECLETSSCIFTFHACSWSEVSIEAMYWDISYICKNFIVLAKVPGLPRFTLEVLVPRGT